VEQNVTLTIDGGKIVSVAPGRVAPGPSDTVIDLSQAWVLPGLISPM
jgi:imidazolonepropionase-like amidohydrolase